MQALHWPGSGRLPELLRPGHTFSLPHPTAGPVARRPRALRHALRRPLCLPGLQAPGPAHLLLGAVPQASSRHTPALLCLPLPADGAGVLVRGVVLVVLWRAGAGAQGEGLQGDRGVCCLAGGRAALHPVSGSGAAGGPTPAAGLLPQGGPEHRRSQQVLQRGPPQVSEMANIMTSWLQSSRSFFKTVRYPF